MILSKEIREQIEGSSEDQRFEAWLHLYMSAQEGPHNQIKALIESDEAALKVLLCRFLAKIPEEKAAIYLCDLLKDENNFVSEAAKFSFMKNRCDGKLPFLLAVLKQASVGVQIFAIDQLALGGVREIFFTLLEMLPQAQGELQLKILEALRYFPDKRLLPVMAAYLKSPNEQIRFKATLVWSKLYELGYWNTRRRLIKLLSDPSARIRKTVLWCLRGRPHRLDIPYLLTLSLEDPDFSVREESLLELAFFPKKKVVLHLLKLIVKETNKLVVLKAETVLMQISAHKLVPLLKNFLKQRDHKIRYRVIRILAEFQKVSDPFYKYLVKQFQKTKNNQEKIALIESFGILGNIKANALLERYVHDTSVMGYASMTALLKINSNLNNDFLTRQLHDDSLHDLLKQMVLKRIVVQNKKEFYSHKNIDRLCFLLASPNINVRYLVAQALTQANDDSTLKPLLNSSLTETDSVAKKYIREAISRLFHGHPQLFLEILAEKLSHQETVLLLFDIIKMVRFTGEEAIQIMLALMKAPYWMVTKQYQYQFFNLLVAFLRKNSFSIDQLLDVAHDVEGVEAILPFMVEHLRETGSLNTNLPPPVLEKLFMKGSDWQKRSVIELMGMTGERLALIFLASLICKEDVKPLHPLVKQAMHTIMRSGT